MLPAPRARQPCTRVTGVPPDPGPPWLITSGEQDPATAERLLRLLPDWFGIESAIADYVAAARHLPTYLARAVRDDREPAGILLAARHFPASAEIHLMAVHPDLRRRGIGRALVAALEADLIADQVEFLQVKTLGPAYPDAGYEQTRRFYAAVGF